MSKTKNSAFPTPFQQIFALFCVLIAEICISLFYFTLASKFNNLLIMDKIVILKNLNQIQTNFDSNVAIATFDHEPKQTFSNNLPLFLGTACCHFAPSRVGDGGGCHFAPPRAMKLLLLFAFAEMLRR
jgi:hypothetical protein